jgi:DNA ligase D-like protein (predicted ligase)
MSRNEKKMNNTYPELVEALESQPPGRYILDGEIVAYEGDVTSFSRLQQRMKITDPDEARSSGVKVYLYVFDVLYYDGCDTTGLPLRNRKTLLRQGLEFEGPIRFVRHRNEHGQEYFKEACHRGWEGLIAKDARSKYVHSRSSKWLKFKCGHQQEFVIAGFTEPKGERVGFGALLIGYYDNDTKLRYAGKVGTGYDKRTLKDLRKRMERHEVTTPPFEDKKLPRKGVHWVKPRLVGEFGYTELTGEHRLRHPRFLGLRQDKKPKDVVLEGVQQT